MTGPNLSRRVHPVVFAILIIPYGAAFSYVALALPFLATRTGVDAARMGGIVALSYLPHTLKVVWAPVIDTTLTRKAWYVIGLTVSNIGIIIASSVPIGEATLPLLTIILVSAQLGVAIIAMACESFLALAVADSAKGRAAGWYNAGAFTGSGIGGWAVLKLTNAMPAGWMAGAVVGGALMLCALPLIWLPLPPPSADHPRQLVPAVRQLGRDLVSLVKSRIGWTGLLICLVPVGACAAGNLFNAVPARWGVADPAHWPIFGVDFKPEDVVGIIGGVVGGLVSAGGAMVGGLLADRLPRRLNYALAGSMTALTSVAMALAPRLPWAYIVFTLIYSFFAGIVYAAFTGFVLETIGKGAVATKYNIFASLANVAISYTTTLESRALARWDTTGMLFADALLTAGGIFVLLTMVALTRRKPAEA